MNIRLDHSVLHVTDWDRSNAFYRDVMGAEVIPRGAGFFSRFGKAQLNLHGPGLSPTPLSRHGVAVELGPVPRFGAGGEGVSVYFRDPDGSLLEFISYEGRP
ncbi:VOC family virulence protein [Deinococcus aquiradiocola]|uniref:Virulence protein n=1 Tax=Deinococcus aquiradiocola TaxID=393059 RepID=A0A917PF29_9DEIO|nr:VOC family virulence protein [Deinococcus aquiradiocola]GGJ74206.1 virulence protein [Deinococcus aquiradiocola]